MMAQRIKVDLNLTDEQLGFLIGPANVIFYVLIGIPMARLVDIYPRKIVLGRRNRRDRRHHRARGGSRQSFGQLFSSRMLVGAGGSAHAPGAYSMLSDYFPPAKAAARPSAFCSLASSAGKCARHIPGRAAGEPGGRLARQPLDGTHRAWLAVGIDDGGLPWTADFRVVAAGERNPRGGGVTAHGKAIAGDGGAA